MRWREIFKPSKRLKDEKKRAKRQAEFDQLIKNISGKTLSELTDPVDKSAWIRTYDETHGPRPYHAEPGRAAAGCGKTKAGKPAWQSLPAIASAVEALESNGDCDEISAAHGRHAQGPELLQQHPRPRSDNDDVTMDTHVVGAALLRPLSGKTTSIRRRMSARPTHPL